LKVQVLGIGKVREPHYRDAIDDYKKRIGKHLGIAILETAKESSGRDEDLQAAYLRIRKEHIRADMTVALDRSGRAMSSEQFARWLEGAMVDGVNLISFLVGGPHGLAPSALGEARLVLSLSAMTLPHQMARLLMVEQVYRALTIIRGEPYHK
jgi:23S rRNA (pseudouridine1915-N3)-methyltransferase